MSEVLKAFRAFCASIGFIVVALFAAGGVAEIAKLQREKERLTEENRVLKHQLRGNDG